MPYTLDQLLPRARETARRVVSLVRDGGRVVRLVDDYAEIHGRAALKSDPEVRRELLQRLAHESLLAVCSRVNAALPRRIAGKARAKTAADAALLNAFRAEFFLHLAKELKWSREELESFWQELDRFDAATRTAKPAARKRGEKPANLFVDRCAMLLDPALFELAREASGKFARELEADATRIVNDVFRTPRRAAGGLFRG
jgi:hypothetical protein